MFFVLLRKIASLMNTDKFIDLQKKCAILNVRKFTGNYLSTKFFASLNIE